MAFRTCILLGIFATAVQIHLGHCLLLGADIGVSLPGLNVNIGLDADLTLSLMTDVSLDAAIRLGGTAVSLSANTVGYLLSGVFVSAQNWPKASTTVNGQLGLKISGGLFASLDSTKRWSGMLAKIGLDARVSLADGSLGLDATLYLYAHAALHGGVKGFNIDGQFVAAAQVKGVQVVGADVLVKSYGRWTKITAFAALSADVAASGYDVAVNGAAAVKAAVNVSANVNAGVSV